MTFARAFRTAARGRAVLRPVAAAVAAVAAVAACAAPHYTYVKNSADSTYFKVPASWRVVDQTALKQTLGGGSSSSSSNGSGGTWAVAYDSDASPSPLHLVGSHTDHPIVYASVQRLAPAVRGQVSLDSLRDLLLPVTPAARASGSTGSVFSDFGLIRESVLTPGKGIRGIREVFQYRVQGGPPQTFDQTAYVNDDASKVFVLLLRCSAQCYRARHTELESVVSSFTVREG